MPVPTPQTVDVNLFTHHGEQKRQQLAPLADRMRPRTLEEFIGQQGILGSGRLLRRAIQADRLGSLILHGPPGVGKTTLARIIANTTLARFSALNAVLSGVKDLREAVAAAQQRLQEQGQRSILFIDEVHRFNSAQQDALLPWVENGTVTLIGATTENPFFEVNKALVSRSRLFRLVPLEPDELQAVLQQALSDPQRGYGSRSVRISPAASRHLVDVAGGDARTLLNALELAVETTPPRHNGAVEIGLAEAEESIQQRAVLYDKQGDAHFDTISAFIKSIRGSDPDAALYWLARMVEAGEDPRFILRRMLISAGEDVGLADPRAVVVVESCAAAFDRVGLPEGLYPLAQAALYLAGTAKSNSVMGFFDALNSVRRERAGQVPAHLRDGNRDGKAFGDGVGYRYPHAYVEHWVAQQYLPTALQGQVYWQPGVEGWEGTVREQVQQRRALQLATAAEAASEQGGMLLTAGPDDPAVNRWLAREAAGTGDRLQKLVSRSFMDVQPARHERVLVVSARSLLLAPLAVAATPEGEVVIQCANQQVAERLGAQLELLDTMRRPRLLCLDDRQLSRLAEEQGRFEWILARNPAPGLDGTSLDQWAATLATLLMPAGRIQLLFSQARLGPAAALLAVLQRQEKGAAPKPEDADTLALERIQLAEATAMARLGEVRVQQVAAALERSGLTVASDALPGEQLTLQLSAAAINRWCDPRGAYRATLQTLADTDWEAFQRLLNRMKATALPQPLDHWCLKARPGPCPGETGGNPGHAPRDFPMLPWLPHSHA